MSTFTLELASGQVALVGYGSLISVPSLERTLGRRYDRTLAECLIAGWRRAWNVAMPNKRFFAEGPDARFYPDSILYLNAVEDPRSVLNAVVFAVTEAELAAFDAREWIYDRAEVGNSFTNGAVTGGPAFMYVAKPQYVAAAPRSPADAAVRETYLRIVEDGLAAQTEGFRARYRDATDPVPGHLVIADRIDEER